MTSRSFLVFVVVFGALLFLLDVSAPHTGVAALAGCMLHAPRKDAA